MCSATKWEYPRRPEPLADKSYVAYSRDSSCAKFPPNVVHRVNVPCNLFVGSQIDVQDLVRRNPYFFSSQGKFKVIFRLRHPKATCFIFSTGSMVVVGVWNVYLALLAAWKAIFEMRRAGLEHVGVYQFRESQITCTADFGSHIDVERAHDLFPKNNFKPDLFPGCAAQSAAVDTRATILFFTSGKCVITGVLDGREALEVYQHSRARLAPFFVRGDEEVERLKRRAEEMRHVSKRKRKERPSSGSLRAASSSVS